MTGADSSFIRKHRLPALYCALRACSPALLTPLVDSCMSEPLEPCMLRCWSIRNGVQQLLCHALTGRGHEGPSHVHAPGSAQRASACSTARMRCASSWTAWKCASRRPTWWRSMAPTLTLHGTSRSDALVTIVWPAGKAPVRLGVRMLALASPWGLAVAGSYQGCNFETGYDGKVGLL